MNIQLTATQTLVNGQAMANEPTKKAIGDQLKYMLFGTVPTN
jgi:hypothetical protein